jgi:hypothetical protein
MNHTELSGSSTANQLQALEVGMKEIMKRIDQMALSTNQQPQVEIPRNLVGQTRNDLESLAQVMYDGSKQQAFMQAHSLLKPLHGNEGHSKIQAYFNTFESMTRGWSSQRQADLLAPHLESQAQLAYESLGPTQRRDYDLIKDVILQSNADSSSFLASIYGAIGRGHTSQDAQPDPSNGKHS